LRRGNPESKKGCKIAIYFRMEAIRGEGIPVAFEDVTFWLVVTLLSPS
jgi:hypothetical protein